VKNSNDWNRSTQFAFEIKFKGFERRKYARELDIKARFSGRYACSKTVYAIALCRLSGLRVKSDVYICWIRGQTEFSCVVLFFHA